MVFSKSVNRNWAQRLMWSVRSTWLHWISLLVPRRNRRKRNVANVKKRKKSVRIRRSWWRKLSSRKSVRMILNWRRADLRTVRKQLLIRRNVTVLIKRRWTLTMLQLPTLLLQDLMYRVKAAIVTVRVARPTDREITTEEITTTIKIASRSRLSNRKWARKT